MQRTHHRTDPKADRVRAALGVATDAAHRLAAVADEVSASAGTRVGHRRFVHVVIEGPGDWFVVEASDTPITLRRSATVLIVPRDAARALLPSPTPRALAAQPRSQAHAPA